MPMFRMRSRRGKLESGPVVANRGTSTKPNTITPTIVAPSSITPNSIIPNSITPNHCTHITAPPPKSISPIGKPDRNSPMRDNKEVKAAREAGGQEHPGLTRQPSHKQRSKRHSRQELEGRGHGRDAKDGSAMKQELVHLSLARQALEAEKAELSRLLEQREGIITELRKQMHHRDKTIQAQRAQYEDALRNTQNGKRDSSGGRLGVTGGREELQLVRDAITSLRSNFRGTDPNQHTLDTLEQAIAVLIERAGTTPPADKATRPAQDKRPNGMNESSTKVIYFTERTVTPFMSTINKRLGDIRLRDFKNMFDRPGLFRYHFKSHDPEYGMVKEEIFSDDDILPGVEGKIIAWVEEDTD